MRYFLALKEGYNSQLTKYFEECRESLKFLHIFLHPMKNFKWCAKGVNINRLAEVWNDSYFRILERYPSREKNNFEFENQGTA